MGEPREDKEERPPVPAKHSTGAEGEDAEGIEDDDAVVDESSKDSYPASDPPAW